MGILSLLGGLPGTSTVNLANEISLGVRGQICPAASKIVKHHSAQHGLPELHVEARGAKRITVVARHQRAFELISPGRPVP